MNKENQGMADEENSGKGSDKGLFVDSIDAAARTDETGFLGDKAHVESILRLAASEVLDVLPSVVDDPEGPRKLIEAVGRKRMRSFFGINGHKPVRKFNEPGGVDVFVAKWCGIEADKPTDRLVGGFACLVGDLVDIEAYAKEEGSLPEQWQWQVDVIFDRYAMIFMGISPPMQELLT